MSLPTPTLHTARLLLRPFTEADTDAIFALHSSPRVLRYWDSPPWKTRAQAERFIAVCRQIEQEGTGARLAIERAADGVFIGWCGLVKWDPGYRSAKMGYCLDDVAWGQGFATEAAGAVLQWAFDTLDLNRVQSEADTRNTASSRVLEKLGFVREGTLREDCIVDGEVSDSWVYGLLRRERKPLQSVSFSVRAVSPQDTGAWCALRRLLWQHVSDDDHMLETQRLLADPHRYATFIAFSDNNAPVGFAEAAVRHDYVNGCKTSPVLFLEGIYVIPDARRAGIARALCGAMAQWGCAHGCTEFASDTQLDNVHAQALHRALGFEETERVVFFRKLLIG